MIYRIYALVKKEFRQIRRDARTLYLIFLFPVFLLILFGYALSLDVKNVKIAIKNNDNSAETRDFIAMMQSSGYFKIAGYIQTDKEINTWLDEKLAQCVIVFPPNFTEDMRAGKNVKLQFLVDGVDGNTATVIMNYVTSATRFYNNKITQEFLERTGLKSFTPIDPQPLFWYNPDLNTTKFLIPGLFCMILITTGVILTTLSIVREKELGSMEQLRVSPMGSLELIIGKTIPYTVVALFVAAFTLLISNIAFGLEIKGNYLLLLGTTLVFLIATLSLGIFISAISDSQQVAFQVASVATMLPTFILSGFIFPIESMPLPVQILTNITPAKFYIVIIRAIILKGVGITAFWQELLSLAAFAVFFTGIAAIKMKKSNV
ncbi:MAG: multidrug ABC transporter permease [Chlorobi bacterium OLB5]|nr:MAG: multidrug ABC transporter permease [Chlorobi bacterium OLB5]